MEIQFSKKKKKTETITVQLLVQSSEKFLCNMESCYRNIFKIRNVTFIFQNITKNLKNKP